MSFSSINAPSINTIAVYFPKSSSVVTMSRYLNSDEIKLFFGDYPEIAAEKLEQLSFSNYRNNYQVISGNHNWIIRKVVINSTDIAYIMIQYNINDLISHYSMDMENVFISFGTVDNCLFSYPAALDDAQYQNIRADAEKRHVFRLESSYLAESFSTKIQGTCCVIGIPIEKQNSIQSLLTMVIVLASVSTLLGLGILLHNVRKNILNPLEALIQRHGADSPGQKKLVSSLISQYQAMEQDRAQLKRERDYLIPLAMGRYLARLNEASDAEKATAIAESCLTLVNLSDSSVAVFAVCCVADNNQYLDSVVSGKYVSITTLHFLLDNVLKDLLFDRCPGIIAPLGKNSFAVIVGCDDENLAFVNNQADELVSFFHNQVSTELISISATLCSSPSEVADAITNIFREISFLAFWETKTDIKESPGEITGFYQSCLRIRNIISALTEDNVTESFAQLDQLVRSITQYKDSKNAKYRLYSLTTYIVAAVDEYCGKSDSTEDSERFEHRLYEARNITDYIEQMHSILLETLKTKESVDRTTFISSRMNDIRDYLQEHFRENSLTVTSVASQFEISVSYLSRSFKSAYGINLLEYIQRLRVDEAKKLLPENSVQNVAREVGFWDTQALIRSFKKLEGINPGDYKRMIENEHGWV